MHTVCKFFRDEPYLFWVCADEVIRNCIPEVEIMSIIEACYSSPVEGHHGGTRTTHKFYIMGTIGRLSTKMPMIMLELVTSASDKKIFCENISSL